MKLVFRVCVVDPARAIACILYIKNIPMYTLPIETPDILEQRE